jgi:acyl-CoA thioester hydrolase
MTALQTLLEFEVLPEYIDRLGHMNVRYYARRMKQGVHALVAQLGYRAVAGVALVEASQYVRYHREQLLGAPLAVRGGVLAAATDGLQLYVEVINRETGYVAATFVLQMELGGPSSPRRNHFDAGVVARAGEQIVALPEYAAPKTLSIGPLHTRAKQQDLEALNLAVHSTPVAIPAELCDEQGCLLTDDVGNFFRFVHFGVVGDTPVVEDGNNLRTEDGTLASWAMMETRGLLYSAPRLGEHIQVYIATTLIGEKVSAITRWVFNVDTHALCAIIQNVMLAFDIKARRAIPIPLEEREQLEKSYFPELL